MKAVSDPEDLPSGDEPSSPRLRAAKPDPEELEGRPAYMPSIPWKWALVAVLALAGVYFGYQYREGARADAMREQILTTHEEHLAPIVERYRTFRTRIEDWTMEAANAGEPERWSDPRLRISGLHGGEGLYLRLHAEDATSREGVERGGRAMREDAITRCLGIAPASARGLFENGEFLMPSWLDQVREEPDYLRLRVLDEQLARNMSVDVPIVANLLRAQYFLLVIEQGENRRDAPVDVYLWDLRENRQLLRTRVQARGVLIPVRIDRMLPGVQVQDAPGVPAMTSGGAHDCSIAAQIKAITGDSVVEVGQDTIEALREAAEAQPSASDSDAGTPSAGETPTVPAPATSAPTTPTAPTEGTAPTPPAP
ncbi:MAG: hypothetical protein K1X94_03390 [Sandaracinaceae bacterium]|nr:hypothetical protein [Sandaracinaceae bacterium]